MDEYGKKHNYTDNMKTKSSSNLDIELTHSPSAGFVTAPAPRCASNSGVAVRTCRRHNVCEASGASFEGPHVKCKL